MSLIPDFPIGIWNAWIFMLYELLTIPIFVRLAKAKASTPNEKQLASLSKTNELLLYSSKLIFVPAGVYSVFLPLKLGTLWFYIGLPIALLGIVTSTIVLVHWARTPPDEPITSGLYRYSRHPYEHHSMGDVHRGVYSFGFVGFSGLFDCIYNSFVCYCNSRRTVLP